MAGALAGHESNPEWGELARWLQLCQRAPPRGGTDAGDHPPITPVRCAARGGVRGGPAAWALYAAVVKHFLATLLPAVAAPTLTLTLTPTPTSTLTLTPTLTLTLPQPQP